MIGLASIASGPIALNGVGFWTAILPSLIAGMAVLISGFVSAFLAYHFGLRRERMLQEQNRRCQILAELHGLRHVLPQLAIFKVSAQAFAKFYNALWLRVEKPGGMNMNNSRCVAEGERRFQREEQLSERFMEEIRRLYGLLGEVRILFPPTPELQNLLAQVEQSKTLLLADPDRGLVTPEQLRTWRERVVDKAVEFAERNYEKPLTDVVEYLQKRLNPASPSLRADLHQTKHFPDQTSNEEL